ncbi:hypothetical protein INT46_008269 [Mucor plumbeus]|uniref:Rab-GAP TBC domain-containing protein n=1 Tax=Mucor plumbeus TaxID=97098 RepID=A0A8H7RQV6_9FUNG|nr:hypothetical protein INT46_008269 [Mucor plumbeus]
MGVKMSVARSMRRAQQTQDILEAMAKNDFDELKRLARRPEGFVDDKLRKYVWPVLLHTQHGNYLAERGSEKDLADPIQISKDVERSLYYYPQVLGKKAAIPAAENVALFFIRDAMLDSFDPISKQLRLMSSLIEYEDPELTLFLEKANIMPYYALSWVLTWFSHDFEAYEKVIRLFDLFISSQAIMPVYIASAITLLRRNEILKAEKDLVHSLITQIPQDMDIERLIEKAVLLEEKYSILQLQKQSGIWLHDESVINTWEKDWGILKWEQVPDQLQVNRYLSHQVEKEEWEDEMLLEWTRRRRGSIEEDDDFMFR